MQYMHLLRVEYITNFESICTYTYYLIQYIGTRYTSEGHGNEISHIALALLHMNAYAIYAGNDLLHSF